MERGRARLLFSLLMAGLFIVPLLMEPAQAGAQPTFTTASCAGHPRNADGFVTDGTPQCGLQWCVGNDYQKDACDAAMHNGFITTGRPQLDDDHCIGPLASFCLAVRHPPEVRIASAVPSYGPRNSRESCILSRENGGDFGRSSNSDHFGAFQFSRSTWAAHGGNPDTWGYASPAEQWQVFYNTVAANGYSDWAPYDNC